MQEQPCTYSMLPAFSNMPARCAQCGARREIRVHFELGCDAVYGGGHFHRICSRCAHRWAEQCSENLLPKVGCPCEVIPVPEQRRQERARSVISEPVSISDQRTGLMWEKKDNSGGLHINELRSIANYGEGNLEEEAEVVPVG